jgi:hypothetical protein
MQRIEPDMDALADFVRMRPGLPITVHALWLMEEHRLALATARRIWSNGLPYALLSKAYCMVGRSLFCAGAGPGQQWRALEAFTVCASLRRQEAAHAVEAKLLDRRLSKPGLYMALVHSAVRRVFCIDRAHFALNSSYFAIQTVTNKLADAAPCPDAAVPLRQQVLALHKEVLQWRLDSAYNAPLELAECHENIAVWELFYVVMFWYVPFLPLMQGFFVHQVAMFKLDFVDEAVKSMQQALMCMSSSGDSLKQASKLLKLGVKDLMHSFDAFNSYRPRKCSREISPVGCDLQKRVTPLGGGAGVIGVNYV